MTSVNARDRFIAGLLTTVVMLLIATAAQAYKPTRTTIPLPSPTPQRACVGDCDENGTVTIAELIVSVRVAMGEQYDVCPAIDSNDDAHASVDELVDAVRNALEGCALAVP